MASDVLLFSKEDFARSSTSLWDLGNRVLYDLCFKYPKHDSNEAVIAKIWLIGRSYAAAIERFKNKTEDNDSFYENTVAPQLIKSDIDNKLATLDKYNTTTFNNIADILGVHKHLTDIFKKITKQNNRSLSSKYLHFHKPHLFFIYDSRAEKTLNKVMRQNKCKHEPRNIINVDSVYAKCFIKAVELKNALESQYGEAINWRRFDNLLLRWFRMKEVPESAKTQ